MTARPSAPPSWRLTLSRAEAMPLRSAGTPDMAATEVGMSTSPAPRPTMTSGPIRLVSRCPDTGSRASRNMPPNATSDPAAVVNRTPIRDTTAGPGPGRDEDGQAERDVGQAGAQRGVAEYLLLVERGRVEHREDRAAQQGGDQVGAGHRAVPPQGQRHQRVAGGEALVREEAGQQDGRPGQQRDGAGRAPWMRLRLHDGVGQQAGRPGGGQRPDEVEPAARPTRRPAGRSVGR